MGETTASERQRVRVWTGKFPIVDQTTTAKAAREFAQAMGRRFTGLPITIENADQQADVSDDCRRLGVAL